MAGRSGSLLDEIDHVTGVSGGSFTAAYLALHGRGIFEDFEQRFLRQDVQGVLIGQLLAPWNWALLASPFFERSDLIARYSDRHGSASPLAARDPTCQNLPRSFHEAGFRGLRAA